MTSKVVSSFVVLVISMVSGAALAQDQAVVLSSEDGHQQVVAQVPVPGSYDANSGKAALLNVGLSSRVSPEGLHFGGIVDAARKFSSPATFKKEDYPWLIRTLVVWMLLKHRVWLGQQLVSFGLKDRNLGIPAECMAHYQNEEFGYFQNEFFELVNIGLLAKGVDAEHRRFMAGENRQRRNESLWVILGHAQKIAGKDIDILKYADSLSEASNSLGIAGDRVFRQFSIDPDIRREDPLSTLLDDRARLEAFAPRVLTYGLEMSGGEERQTLLNELELDYFLNGSRQLPEWFTEDLPKFEAYVETGEYPEIPQDAQAILDEEIVPLVQQYYLVSLFENFMAMKTLCSARREQTLDVFLYADQLEEIEKENIMIPASFELYPGYENVFREALAEWKDRARGRIHEYKDNRKTRYIVAGVAAATGMVLPVSWGILPASVLAVLRGGATGLFLFNIWQNYLRIRHESQFHRALYAGSAFFGSARQYRNLLEKYGKAKSALVIEGVFAIMVGSARIGNASAHWRNSIQNKIPLAFGRAEFWRTSPQGLSVILRKMDQWRDAMHATRPAAGARPWHWVEYTFARWRGNHAIGKIAKVEERLRRIKADDTLEVLHKHADFALNRTRVAIAGLEFQWVHKAEEIRRGIRAGIPNPLNFLKPRYAVEAFTDTWKFFQTLGQQRNPAGYAGNAVLGALKDPFNVQNAISMVLIQSTVLALVETLGDQDRYTNDDAWKYIFPVANKKGFMVNLFITDFTISVMSFVGKVNNPWLRLIPPGVTAILGLGQKITLGDVDKDRNWWDLKFDLGATGAYLPFQLWMGWGPTTLLANRILGAGGSMLTHQAGILATGIGIMTIYTQWAAVKFEDEGDNRDEYGNYYRTPADNGPFIIPSGVYKVQEAYLENRD